MKKFLHELQIKTKNPESEYRPMDLGQIEREALANGNQEIKQLYKHQPKEQEDVEASSLTMVEGV